MSVVLNNVLLQAGHYENYNSVITNLVNERRNSSVLNNPLTPNFLLPVHSPFPWTLNLQEFHFVIMPLMCFQDMLNATF
jgi:hypothetical protein